MSAKIFIGDQWRPLRDATPQWIIQTFLAYKAANGKVCVRVRVAYPDLVVGLQTKGCPPLGQPCSRDQFNPEERRLIDLWNQLGLNEPNVTHGQVVAFVQQVNKKIGVAA